MNLETTSISMSESQCNPSFLNIPLDSNDIVDHNIKIAGNLYNQFLDFYLQSAIVNNIRMTSNDFDTHFRKTIKDFFINNHFIMVDDSFYYCISTTKANDEEETIRASLTNSGKGILIEVLQQFNDFEENRITTDQFYVNMENLYVTSHLLNNQDVIPLKLMINVGMKSLEYWHENLDNWVSHFSLFTEENAFVLISSQPLTKSQKLGRIALSDAIGAIRGGIVGIPAGGPIGSIASALVVGGFNSAVMRNCSWGQRVNSEVLKI